MDPDLRAALAPTGELRAAINLSNMLLVTGRAADGAPAGVAPDLAAALAARLGVGLRLLPYPGPGELADAAGTGAWDVGLIGAEPQRARRIAFTAPYARIEATFLVPAGSAIADVAAVDRPGLRIAVPARAAYGLRLQRTVRHATLVLADDLPGASRRFAAEGLDALAGLRPRLLEEAAELPGARVLDGHFATVDQAIGMAPGHPAALAFLEDFVAASVRDGLVAALIARHGVHGLSVAEAAR